MEKSTSPPYFGYLAPKRNFAVEHQYGKYKSKMDGELFDGRQEALDAVRNYYKQQNIIVYES